MVIEDEEEPILTYPVGELLTIPTKPSATVTNPPEEGLIRLGECCDATIPLTIEVCMEHMAHAPSGHKQQKLSINLDKAKAPYYFDG